MDEDIQEGGDPAEAFDRLRAVIEGQDRELALLRRAVEGLAAERAHIDVPDYSETLGRMQQGVDATANGLAVINDVIARSPALAMTPEHMAQRIAAAGNAARREDQAAFAIGRKGLEDVTRQLQGLVALARHASEQNRWLAWSAIGGVATGMMLWAVGAGVVARAVPESWLWPEKMATRSLRLDTWTASRRLAAVSQPGTWNTMVAGAVIVQENRKTIDDCRKAAARADEPVRCTVKIAAEER
ncbi:MAG: DUF6118 family protein [Pseudomonadota bacterium]